MLQEVVQQIEETARSVVNEVHTALPGEILSFDSESTTATIKPIGSYLTSDGIRLAYPLLTEVPILFPFSPSVEVGIVFPVKKGDHCLILLSETELEEWRSGAASESSLRFDLSNAVAILGLQRNTIPSMTKAVEKDAVLLLTSGTEICVSKEGIEVTSRDSKIQVSEMDINVTSGSTKLQISKTGIEVLGDLKVDGTIWYTEAIKAIKKGE